MNTERRRNLWIELSQILRATVLLIVGTDVALHAQGSRFALRFYGTGVDQRDRVRIRIDDDAPGPDASAPCDVGRGSFTLEFWLRGRLADNRTTSGGGDRSWSDFRWIDGNIVLDRDIFGGSAADFGVSLSGGFVRFGTGSGDVAPDSENTIEGSVNVLDGLWHHVAVVRDAASGRKTIIVDGVEDFSSAAGVSRSDLSYPDSGVPSQVTPWGPYIVLGAEKHDAGSAYPSFNGYVDELRVWRVARTASEVLSDYDRVVPADAAGLEGYYRFEEGSGTRAVDSSAAGGPDGEVIAGMPGNGEWVGFASDPANTAPVSDGPLPAGFTRTRVAGGLQEPTVIEFTPDGRLLAGERGGRIRVVEAGRLLPAPLVEVDAETSGGERGLVGLAVDPAFAANGFIYAYYTTREPRNRVGRFRVEGSTADPASEVVIWQNPDLAAEFHHGGCVLFGPDQHLYISTGDQFQSSFSQSLGNQHGKLLRLRPDGSVPGDNPFAGGPAVQAPIWALGLRNPFRVSFDPPSGRIWIGDVGGNSSDSWEEVNLAQRGANFGWPQQEGPLCYVPSCAAFTFPRYSYRHDDPRYRTTQDQASISLGPVYRGSAFPAAYRGNLFVGDYANRWIRRLVLDASGAVIADPLFVRPPDAGSVVDLDVGTDGALYYVTVGIPWSGAPDEGAVWRVAYTGLGNQAPVAVASAAPLAGIEPLEVRFSSAGSLDPDAGPEPLAYLWDFGDGSSSSDPNPLHVYTRPGRYAAVLMLSDGEASAQSVTLAITVGSPPVPVITRPAAGAAYRAGDVVAFEGEASDLEDGVLAPAALSWSVVLRHSEHVHPFLGPLSGVTGGTFTVPRDGHTPEDTSYEVVLTATDSSGLAASTSRAVVPVTATLVIETDPPGIPVFLDGEALSTPRAYDSLVGFEHLIEAQEVFVLGGVPHTFGCWSDGGARSHRFTTPEAGLRLVARYTSDGAAGAVEAAVESDDRDADYSPQFGERLSNYYDAGGLCSGRDDGGQYQTAMAFALQVPQGAQVLSAVLRVVATSDQSGSPRAELRAYDVASAAPFSPAHTHALSAHHPLTGAVVEWVFPAFAPGQSYSSPDLAMLVQEVVERPDWQAGSFLGIVADGGASASGSWRCWRNFPAGSPAVLRVEYFVPAEDPGGPDPCAPSGVPWRRCDFNCDGAHDLSDAVAGLRRLFSGAAGPCCEALADCNQDGAEDISDWIFLLIYLFSGGVEPDAPFRDCGKTFGESCERYPACP